MSSRTIWRRRLVLMVVVGLFVAVPATLVINGDDEDPGRPPRPSIDARFPLNPTVTDSAIEAEYAVPKGWSLTRPGGALALHSRDGSVRIGVTSPDSADRSEEVLAEALGVLEATYSEIEVRAGLDRSVGGLDARGAVVHAQGNGTELRILVSVAAGEGRAYLVEVFAAAAAPARRLAEAQRFLDSLRLRG